MGRHEDVDAGNGHRDRRAVTDIRTRQDANVGFRLSACRGGHLLRVGVARTAAQHQAPAASHLLVVDNTPVEIDETEHWATLSDTHVLPGPIRRPAKRPGSLAYATIDQPRRHCVDQLYSSARPATSTMFFRLLPFLSTQTRPWCLGLAVVGLLAICVSACSQHSVPAAKGPAASGGNLVPPGPELAELQAAIDSSARYLAGLCDDQGKFAYLFQLEPEVEVGSQYNVLRHAGAVYSLAQYCQRTPDHEVHQAMLRGAEFLRRKCMAPVADNPNLLAVWSEPELTGRDQPREAKLGGAGLALVALISVERAEPGFVSVNELRGLGRFLVFMQKSDGSFYSKFFPGRGRSDVWQSMYYPGEAALGLLMLYEMDPAPQWLHTARKALVNLSRKGELQHPILPDQWFLLSGQRWFAMHHDPPDPESGEAILGHTRQLCREMLAEQRVHLGDSRLHGCYTPEARSCPSATRLEGLLAALTYLTGEEDALRQEIRKSVQIGMEFLLRCQIVEGPHAGALTRFLPGATPVNVTESEKKRANEVRIDYIQHALSAMIAYERELCSDK